MSLVTNDTINLGTTNAFYKDSLGNKIASTYKVQWTIADTTKKIVHIQPDCGGCTKNAKQEGNLITADFTPGTTGSLTKGITVFLEDDKPLMVLNDTDDEILNMEKEKVRLFIKGNYV